MPKNQQIISHYSIFGQEGLSITSTDFSSFSCPSKSEGKRRGSKLISMHLVKDLKSVVILLILLFGFQSLKAQEEVPQKEGIHQHEGFYLSMGLGPVFGNVIAEINPFGYNPPTVNFNGTAALFDFKIGASIYENLILHATLVSNVLAGPTVTTTSSPRDYNPSIYKMPDSYSIRESMLGVGFTKYGMLSNVFFSGSIGVGYFSTVDTKDSKNNFSTDPGISMQVKVGREWWISKNWGLGIGVSYGKTKLRNLPPNEDAEKFNSNRIGILLNTTVN